MKQIFFIHGGDSYSSYEEYMENLTKANLDYERMKPTNKWRDTISELVDNAEMLTPTMPNSANAQFDEWKIWFEKIIPHFGDDVRLIGHSLGAMFLAKYLHTNTLPKPVRQLHLIAGGYNAGDEIYGSFKLLSAKGLEKSAQEVHLYHSQDDPIVPFEELAKYRSDLPTAVIHTFKDRNHFLDSEFPEIIELLNQK